MSSKHLKSVWTTRMEDFFFYLTTHSTHFIYSHMASDIWYRTIQIAREETSYRHMGYSFQLAARFFYMHHPTDRIAHTTAFVTPVVEHWLDMKYSDIMITWQVSTTSVVRWVVGSIFHGVDPLSYFSFQPVLHDWCNKGCGMCYPVCGMVHIKDPLLLIDKSSLCGSSGFPLSLSEWSLTICLMPYNRR